MWISRIVPYGHLTQLMSVGVYVEGWETYYTYICLYVCACACGKKGIQGIRLSALVCMGMHVHGVCVKGIHEHAKTNERRHAVQWARREMGTYCSGCGLIHTNIIETDSCCLGMRANWLNNTQNFAISF